MAKRGLITLEELQSVDIFVRFLVPAEGGNLSRGPQQDATANGCFCLTRSHTGLINYLLASFSCR